MGHELHEVVLKNAPGRSSASKSDLGDIAAQAWAKAPDLESANKSIRDLDKQLHEKGGALEGQKNTHLIGVQNDGKLIFADVNAQGKATEKFVVDNNYGTVVARTAADLSKGGKESWQKADYADLQRMDRADGSAVEGWRKDQDGNFQSIGVKDADGKVQSWYAKNQDGQWQEWQHAAHGWECKRNLYSVTLQPNGDLEVVNQHLGVFTQVETRIDGSSVESTWSPERASWRLDRTRDAAGHEFNYHYGENGLPNMILVGE